MSDKETGSWSWIWRWGGEVKWWWQISQWKDDQSNGIMLQRRSARL